MSVFWLSGLVDRPSDCMYVHTIPLSGCMDRRSQYNMGNIQLIHWCHWNMQTQSSLYVLWYLLYGIRYFSRIPMMLYICT